ncbi:hypothetical protein ACH4NV_31020 [Streptomyces althioticus]|uniref:hypothetical protein n=1 Tax=Streptomyces althioticus TaxID=83380 RepID=UPI001993E1E5|nr:hypothetical protein GCM10010267_47800 [Streptomyces griseorubens]
MTVTDLDRTGAATAPEPAPGPARAAEAPLRTRPGLHYAPVAGGVYFSGTRGQFVLRGSDLMYAVADACVPLLEAGTTENALVAEFGTERARPAVRHLVARLRETGLLLDPTAFTEPEPPAEVRDRYADVLARLTARLDDPYAAFARLRRARVELRGPAAATAPARRGLLRAGVTRVTSDDGDTMLRPLVPVCDPAMYADPALLVPLPAGDPAAHGAETPAGDPAAEHLRTPTPAGGPADGPGARTPAGGPAALVPEDFHPAGDPATASSPGSHCPRAVVEFLTGDETWTERHGVLHVPVLLGPGPALVGPAGASPDGWAAFRDRARDWAATEGVEAPPGPVARALTGAVAAQLLTDTLTGVAEPGEAYVVHGADLTTDRVTVTGGPVGEAVVVRLDDVPAEPLPAPEASLEAAGVLTARWTGLFASVQGEHLPQMPLALRAAEHRAGRTGAVTAWAAHQEQATVAAALTALRDRVTGAPGSAAAAGLTLEHWLLDGALRVLAARRERFEPVDGGPAPLHAEGERILAALRTQLGTSEPVVALTRTAGVGWLLAEVTADGRELGSGWGPTAADAAYAALCTALAAEQAHGSVPVLSTDALLTVDAATRTSLRKQLTAFAAVQGHSRSTDPVLGEVLLRHGPVTVRTEEETTDAGH